MKISRSVSALFALLPVLAFAKAPKWTLVTTFAPKDTFNVLAFYVDTANIQVGTDGLARAWTMTNSLDEQDTPVVTQKYHSALFLYLIRCNTNQRGILASVYYSEEKGAGTAVYSTDIGNAVPLMEHIIPGTIDDAALAVICHKNK